MRNLPRKSVIDFQFKVFAISRCHHCNHLAFYLSLAGDTPKGNVATFYAKGAL